ncbi:odorant receptor 4-like [Bacillus rossius redtenbacheri]|uniref:odorant receptor 4-like n=1 Tax=Bacillus rossius redtenbacheri TaxID=93214 RepID=UPI002FDEF6D0
MSSTREFTRRARLAGLLNTACGLAVPDPGLVVASPWSLRTLRTLTVVAELLVWAHLLSLGAKLTSPTTSAAHRCIGVFTTLTSVKLMALWGSSGETSEARQELRRAGVVGVVMAAAMVTIAFSYNILSLLPGVREAYGGRHSVPAWFFFDTSTSPWFEATALFQAASASVTVARNVAFDCLFLSLAGALVAWLRRLARDLEAVFADLPDEAPGRVVAARLGPWVRRHQLAAEYGMELQELYSSTWVVQFLCALFILCFTAFYTIAVSLSPLQYVLGVGYALTNLLQLYLLCHCGDRLQEASELLPREAYAAPWYASGRQAHSSLKVVFVRCHRALRLSAMGVVPLSSATFESVVKTTVSYFTVLRKLHTDGGNSDVDPSND